MDKYIMRLRDGKITIQRAEYIEDGCYIEIVGNEITLYEIPYGGGEEQKIDNYKTLIEAIDASKELT